MLCGRHELWRRYRHLITLVGMVWLLQGVGPAVAGVPPPIPHRVQPGDTWLALAYRYQTTPAALHALNGVINPQRQPIIGATLLVPAAAERLGQLVRPADPLPLLLALRHHTAPSHLLTTSAVGEVASYAARLTPHTAYFIPGGDAPPQELPPGFATLAVSSLSVTPGQALGLQAQLQPPWPAAVHLSLEAPLWAALPFHVLREEGRLVALSGVGAFFRPGPHELTIVVDDQLLWSQPWLMQDRPWDYQAFTYTGAAAQLSVEDIRLERERLAAIWRQTTPAVYWQQEFQLPIDQFLYQSSAYGARRSTDGGRTYPTYHEGVDFAAGAGTPVYATAAGIVVVAEHLYVRGGSVILDHGLGVYSGYYHLSSLAVAVGEHVTPGQLVGGVGTTGRSTGNHLHWDVLIGETWVDGLAWVEQGMGCWVLAGLGRPCAP